MTFAVDLNFAQTGKNISLVIAATVEVDMAKTIDSLEIALMTHREQDEYCHFTAKSGNRTRIRV